MKRLIIVTILLVLCSQVANGQAVSSYNYLVGTQTFEPKYQFTNGNRLGETADAIEKLNSNIIKFTMAKNAFDTYRLPGNPRIKSLREFAELDPTMKGIFDGPFSYYFIWAYRHTAADNNYWRRGMTAQDKEEEYREVYQLADYLLSTYGSTEKTFYLGHWEGDWSLLGGFDHKAEPDDLAIKGMIDWLNIRQQAIDDARKAHPECKAAINSYCEVNLVRKAMAGKKTVVNSVLPQVDVDYVSYSCWDSLDVSQGDAVMKEQLAKSLDYIESKMKRGRGNGKKVFIGEFGFPLAVVKSQEAQLTYSKAFIKKGVEWGCPFILYWQIYENEAKEGENGRGQGLINNTGQKTLLHLFLQEYFKNAKAYVEEYKTKHGKRPSEVEFRRYVLGELRD